MHSVKSKLPHRLTELVLRFLGTRFSGAGGGTSTCSAEAGAATDDGEAVLEDGTCAVVGRDEIDDGDDGAVDEDVGTVAAVAGEEAPRRQ